MCWEKGDGVFWDEKGCEIMGVFAFDVRLCFVGIVLGVVMDLIVNGLMSPNSGMLLATAGYVLMMQMCSFRYI